MGGGPAVGREEGDLTKVALIVGGEQLGERVGRGVTRREQIETARAVADLGEGLRRDCADVRTRPRTDADAERTRLDGDAELAGLRVPGDDGVGHRGESTLG